MQDLEDAILFHREDLTLFPPGHKGCCSLLNNLGNSLRTRYDKLGRIEDLEEAITMHRNALTLYPSGHPNFCISLHNLAGCLVYCYDQTGRLKVLDEAISLYRNALDLRSAGHPNHAASLNNLAISLLARHQGLTREQDLEEAFRSYEQATNDSSSFSHHRLHAAIEWVTKARNHRHNSILSACRASLQVLNQCLIAHHSVETQQKILATANISKSFPSDVSSAAIEAGDLELAVEMLEQGRAILWSRVSMYKHPLHEIRQVEGGEQLADRLQTLNTRLENLVLSSGHRVSGDEGPSTMIASEARMREHRILLAEWNALVEKIREIEGFGDFLKATTFSTLQSAAACGPIVLINVSQYRSDAVIVCINRPPALVSLPDARPAEIRDLAEKLGSARDILTVLRYLWANVVSPVVDCLDYLEVPKKSRIWWCPTSELCALPLHAAGTYRRGERNLLDLYTSSYTPALSSLIRARSNSIPLTSLPELLVVGQPGSTLHRVKDEVDIIQRLGGFITVLMESEANVQSVLNSLKQHSWVHFACHGHLGDSGRPFQASFALHDGPLTILDLIQTKLPNAELAFLSACHSAAGDTSTPNEVLHLSAALHFCGFRSVVGTLWEMNDIDGPIITQEFYRYMFRNPGAVPDFQDSAEALNAAIREMRKNRVPLERWVMFVHIGA